MKAVIISVVVASFVTLVAAQSASAGEAPEPLACKPVGAKCHNSFECCSQNCQTVNGKETCH